MKKSFPLKALGKDDARVRDKIRQEVNTYVRRERQKTLPEGFDLWAFNCKVGASAAAAEALPLKEIGGAIDAVAKAGATEVFIAILAAPGLRKFPA
jgi:hypothetical protein